MNWNRIDDLAGQVVAALFVALLCVLALAGCVLLPWALLGLWASAASIEPAAIRLLLRVMCVSLWPVMLLAIYATVRMFAIAVEAFRSIGHD